MKPPRSLFVHFIPPSRSVFPLYLHVFLLLSFLRPRLPPLLPWSSPSSVSSLISPSASCIYLLLLLLHNLNPSSSCIICLHFLHRLPFLCVVMSCCRWPPGWACLPRYHLPLRAGPSPPKKQARAKWVPSPSSPPSPHPLSHLPPLLSAHTYSVVVFFVAVVVLLKKVHYWGHKTCQNDVSNPFHRSSSVITSTLNMDTEIS